jgi:hypothetical protein
VRFDIIGTDAQDLGVEAFEPGKILLESPHLMRSAGCEIFEIKGQDHNLLTEIVR